VGGTALSCVPIREDVPYRLRPLHAPSYCIDLLDGLATAGTALVQNPCTVEATQKFWLTIEAPELISLRSAWSGLCLQASGGSTSPDAAIVEGTCLGEPAQLWSVVVRSDGFSLVQSASELVLDVLGDTVTSPDTPLIQSTDDQSDDMLWQFEPTSGGMVRLEPIAQAGSYLTRVDELVEAVEGSSADALWRILPGLSDPSCVTFEAADEPGLYLRHSQFLIRVDPDDGIEGFKNDATFCLREGLSETGYNLHSLQSVNYTARYLTQPSTGQAALTTSADTDEFRAQATFRFSGN